MSFRPLDETRYAEHASASGLLPLALWDDAQAIGDERHSGCSYAPAPDRRHAVSTPSDVWRAIPIRLRADHTTDTIHVTLRGLVAMEGASSGTNALDVRLVTPSAVGSSTTLQTSASAQSVTLTAAHYPTGHGETVPCEIQIRSRRRATAIASAVSVDDVLEGGLAWIVGPEPGVAEDQATHYEAVIVDWPAGMPTARTSWHVGRVESHSGASAHTWWVWPSSTDALVAQSGNVKLGGEADLYPLGTLTLYGWAAWCSGDRAATGVPRTANVPDGLTYASHWRGLHGAVVAMALARGRVYLSGPRCDGTDACYGYRAAAGDLIAEAGCLPRIPQITASVRLAATTEATATLTLSALDSAGTVVATVDATVVAMAYLGDGTAVEPAYQVSRADESEMLHGVQRWGGGTLAGWRDLPAAGETWRPGAGWVTATVALAVPADAYCRVRLECDADAHVIDTVISEG